MDALLPYVGFSLFIYLYSSTELSHYPRKWRRAALCTYLVWPVPFTVVAIYCRLFWIIILVLLCQGYTPVYHLQIRLADEKTPLKVNHLLRDPDLKFKHDLLMLERHIKKFTILLKKINEGWSSQLYTQLLICSCEKKARKNKFRLVRDSNTWSLQYRCSALPIKLTSQQGAGRWIGSF